MPAGAASCVIGRVGRFDAKNRPVSAFSRSMSPLRVAIMARRTCPLLTWTLMRLCLPLLSSEKSRYMLDQVLLGGRLVRLAVPGKRLVALPDPTTEGLEVTRRGHRGLSLVRVPDSLGQVVVCEQLSGQVSSPSPSEGGQDRLGSAR